MHPADEYQHLKAEIRRLRFRANMIRDGFLSGELALQSNRVTVTIRQHTRRTIRREKLPPDISDDPNYWRNTTTPVLTVQDHAKVLECTEEDFDVIEHW